MAAKKKKRRKAAKKKRAASASPKKRKKSAKRTSSKRKKRLPKNLAAAIAAFSGESRHDDSYVPPSKKPKRLSKKQRKTLLQQAMAAYSGEGRHSDVSSSVAAVVAKAKAKKLTKKERAALLKVAMAAHSGESRHGPQAEFAHNMRLWEIAQAARRRALSNPAKRLAQVHFHLTKGKRKAHRYRGAYKCPVHGYDSYLNQADNRFHCATCGRLLRKPKKKNPIHFPKGTRGRPSKKRYWILDVYKGTKITTYIGERPVDKSTAKLMAMQRLTSLKADKVALSGPYLKKPKKSTLRK